MNQKTRHFAYFLPVLTFFLCVGNQVGNCLESGKSVVQDGYFIRIASRQYQLMAIDGSNKMVSIDFSAPLTDTIRNLLRTSSYEWPYQEFERLVEKYGRNEIRRHILVELKNIGVKSVREAHNIAAKDPMSPLSELQIDDVTGDIDSNGNKSDNKKIGRTNTGLNYLRLQQHISESLRNCQECIKQLSDSEQVKIFNHTYTDAYLANIHIEPLSPDLLRSPNATYHIVGYRDGRPVTQIDVLYSDPTDLVSFRRDTETGRVTEVTRKLLRNGQTNVERIKRNSLGLPTKSEKFDLNGSLLSFSVFSGNADKRVTKTFLSNGSTSEGTWTKYFNQSGQLYRMDRQVAATKYVEEFDPLTGLKQKYSLFSRGKKAATSEVSYDAFGNRIGEQVRYFWGDIKWVTMFFDKYWRSKEVSSTSRGNFTYIYKNDPVIRKPVLAKVTRNGRHIVDLKMEYSSSGDIERTVSYFPNGKLIASYPGRLSLYVNRDASPRDGGKIQRHSKAKLW